METIQNAVWFPKKRVDYINDKFFEPSIPPRLSSEWAEAQHFSCINWGWEGDNYILPGIRLSQVLFWMTKPILVQKTLCDLL